MRRKGPKEIVFDDAARTEYLTGFHKRKLARKQKAKNEAVQKEKEEKKAERDQRREAKKREVEEWEQNRLELLKNYNTKVISEEHPEAVIALATEDAEAGDASDSAEEGNDDREEEEEAGGRAYHTKETVTLVQELDMDQLRAGAVSMNVFDSKPFGDGSDSEADGTDEAAGRGQERKARSNGGSRQSKKAGAAPVKPVEVPKSKKSKGTVKKQRQSKKGGKKKKGGKAGAAGKRGDRPPRR